MKIVHITYSLAFLILGSFSILNTADLKAQNTKTEQVPFKLGSADNKRKVYDFEVTNPGEIEISAKWRGRENDLALILNGPGQTGYYSRKDGSSPLKINFEVTPELVEKGKKWKVSIVNFGNGSRFIGYLKITYPVGQKLHDFEDLQISREQPSEVERNSPQTTVNDSESSEDLQEPGIRRRIMEDGTVELRYPDGTIKRIKEGGYTIIHPDGTQTGAQFIQIPPTTPPQLPADQRINDYLEWQIESLFDMIKQILNNDQESIENFLEHENEIAQSIYDKMYIRTSYLDRLLSN
ncbi:MAG: hypothetical protein WBL27_12580 [Salinimicrobium sp.]